MVLKDKVINFGLILTKKLRSNQSVLSVVTIALILSLNVQAAEKNKSQVVSKKSKIQRNVNQESSSVSDKEQKEILESGMELLTILKEDPKAVNSKEVYDVLKSFIVSVANMKLTSENKESVKLVLQTLVAVDEYDQSRTLAQILSKGYNENKKLYDDQIEGIKQKATVRQKGTIQELHKILSDFYVNGNG